MVVTTKTAGGTLTFIFQLPILADIARITATAAKMIRSSAAGLVALASLSISLPLLILPFDHNNLLLRNLFQLFFVSPASIISLQPIRSGL